MSSGANHRGYVGEVAPDPSVRPYPKKIRVETPKKKRPLPSKEDLVELAVDVYKLALDHERVYVDKHGNTGHYPQPDFKAAILAARLIGELAGHLGAGAKANKRPEESEDEMNVDTAEAAIEKLRSKYATASEQK